MEKLNSIYAKTYNFVYLRAKSILKKEEDIQQLMKEVYLKAVAEDVQETKLFEWLGKQVYALGCAKFRKKKAREAELLELNEQMYSAQESMDRDTTKEVIGETLEELPDMYQATLYACYYDHLQIKEVAALMGYSVGTIINRLNYVNRYLEKTLENYKEETGIRVQFSVEMVCEALRDWSANNQLSEQVAHNVYASICRELGEVAESGVIEVGVAGANCRMRQAEVDDISAVSKEFEAYLVKRTPDKKKILLIAGGAVLILLALVGVLTLGNSEKQDQPIEQDVNVDSDLEEELEVEADVQNDADVTEEPDNTEDTIASDVEYILPKSDKEKLTRADLEGLTKEQLRLARNEIYARHGMIFGVSDLDNYFATKSWYKPTIPFKDFDNKVEMSIVEEQNIILIQQVEKEK